MKPEALSEGSESMKQPGPAQARRQHRKRLGQLAFPLAALLLMLSLLPVGKQFWGWALERSGLSQPLGSRELLELHFIDVGKADAILIRSQGRSALLDAGYCMPDDLTGSYLRRFGVESLEYLIMSHPDKDHIGGMPQVLADFSVNAFVRGPLPFKVLPDSEEYAALNKALYGLPQITLEPGHSIRLGAATLTALGPVEKYKDSNNASLVLRLECQGFAALFCGDMEKKAEKDLLESGQDLSAHVLKVAHHGSKTSTTAAFVSAVSPQLAVVSVGKDRNQLPREEPLRTLEEAGAQIYRTDTDGDVVLLFDGETIRIKTER